MSSVKPGPKGATDLSPLPMKGFPRDKAKRVEKFAKTYILTPKGEGARKPFKFEPFQRELLQGFFKPETRMALVSLARGNGKSTLAAVLAVYDLFTTESAQVIVVASDQRQAGIILKTAQRMIELSPELSKRARLLKDHIEVPGTGGEMYALPADPGALAGWDPSTCIVDELAYVNHDCWEAVTGFAGKRPSSLTLAISTPSDRHDSVMSQLVETGRAGGDPTFYFREWTSDATHPVTCDHCAKAANPSLGAFQHPDGLRSLVTKMREPAFRRYRLNQVVTSSTAWITPEQWKAREDAKRLVSPREPITLGFDGSVSGDATALVACTVNSPHAWIVGLWERPKDDDDWRVPRLDVSNVLDQTFRSFNVVELACDPFSWRGEIQEWSRKYGRARVLEFPTNARGRMGPAVDLTTEAVLEGKLTHAGDPNLTRHVLNVQVTHTKYGDQIAKQAPKSEHKIDAAVCLVIAYSRAVFHAGQTRKRGLKVVNGTW